MNLGFLSRNIGGLPAWAWGGIVIGGGLAVWYFFRRQGGTLAGPAGQQQQQVDTSQIDPNTGVPYSIEEAINPATGLPAYYGGPGVDTQTNTPPAPGPTSGPPGPPTPVPPTSGPPGPPVPKPPVAGPPTTTKPPGPKPNPKPKRKPPNRRRRDPRLGIGDGPDEGGGDGPDEGTGGGPSCPLGLGCAGGCRGLCQTQATPFWPVMTDVGGGRY